MSDLASLIEAALSADQESGQRDELNQMLSDDPAAQAAWIAHRRLVVRLHGLAPCRDLGTRVLAIVQTGRKSRRSTVATGARHQLARQRFRRWAIGTLAAAAVLAIAAFPLLGRVPGVELHHGDGRIERLAIGATLTTTAGAELRWPDGSIAAFAPGSQASVTSDGVRLDTGLVDCAITPRSNDVFRITTAQAEATVIGTRFRCISTDQGCAVAVSEGRVRLTSAAGELLLAPGEAGQTSAGLPPQRETVLLHWPGSAGTTDLGTLGADGVVRSGIYRDQLSTAPCIRLLATPGQSLFTWAPGQMLRAAVRFRGRQLKLQCHDQGSMTNSRSVTTMTTDAWTVVSFQLDGLQPYDAGHPLRPGAQIDHLLLIPDPEVEGPPFELAWIEVVAAGGAR